MLIQRTDQHRYIDIRNHDYVRYYVLFHACKLQDNIPGVKGIGEKTAAALLKHFHSVPDMYRRLGLIGLPQLPPHLTNALPTSQLVKAHMLTVMPKHVLDAAVTELSVCFGGSETKAATALARLYMCGYDNICLYKHLVTLKDDVDIEQIVLHSTSTSDVVDRYKSKVEVIAATADLPQTHESSAQVQGLVCAMQDVLLDRAADADTVDDNAADVNAGSNSDGNGSGGNGSGGVGARTTLSGVHGAVPKLTTDYFRYRGERGAHAEALTAAQPPVTAASTPAAVKKHKKAAQQRSAAEVEALLQDISPALAAPLRLLREQYHRLPKD